MSASYIFKGVLAKWKDGLIESKHRDQSIKRIN